MYRLRIKSWDLHKNVQAHNAAAVIMRQPSHDPPVAGSGSVSHDPPVAGSGSVDASTRHQILSPKKGNRHIKRNSTKPQRHMHRLSHGRIEAPLSASQSHSATMGMEDNLSVEQEEHAKGEFSVHIVP